MNTPLSRRDFIRRSAGLLAAPTVLRSGILGAYAPSKRVNVACIGLRNMGSSHVRTLLGDPAVHLHALCDVDRGILDDRLAQLVRMRAERTGRDDRHSTSGHADYREVVARDDIDAIVIATPDHTHAGIAVAALQAGKHVYVEKPMTVTIAEGRAVCTAAARHGRIVQVGSQRRSSATVRRVCHMVRTGRIGSLLRVEVGCGSRPLKSEPWRAEPPPPGFDYDLWLGPAPWQPYARNRCHYNFRFIRDYAGGELTNFGSHFLDVAQWGIGADNTGPVLIEGAGEAHADGLYDVFHTFRVEYVYAGGIRLICTSGPPGVRFIGADGWIDDAGRGEPAVIARGAPAPELVDGRPQNDSHMQNFIRCVRTGEEAVAPAETGHRTATVCHLGNIAMTCRRPLHWHPDTEEFGDDDDADAMRARARRAPFSLV